MVLTAQAHMVWQVAHLYYQRPTVREIIRLYANVGATALLVREIEDLDVSEQVEPVITAALRGSLASAVPGATFVASLVTNSILEGTANAFLTLRVGIIARQYCASLTAVNRKSVRRFASVQAATVLGAIVLQSAGVVSKAIVDAARKAGVGTWESVAGGVAKGTRGLSEKLGATIRSLRRSRRRGGPAAASRAGVAGDGA